MAVARSRTGARRPPWASGSRPSACSAWFPGDTGLRPDITQIRPVDIALMPIGGWGPTLPDDHLDPEQAVTAVGQVGAEWALAVHYGTYWPIGMRRLRPSNHQRLFVTPPRRFREAVRDQALATVPLTPSVGERVVLVSDRDAAPRAGPS